MDDELLQFLADRQVPVFAMGSTPAAEHFEIGSSPFKQMVRRPRQTPAGRITAVQACRTRPLPLPQKLDHDALGCLVPRPPCSRTPLPTPALIFFSFSLLSFSCLPARCPLPLQHAATHAFRPRTMRSSPHTQSRRHPAPLQGRDKVLLAHAFASMGVSILVSDVDTVWLRNPLPYLSQVRGGPPPHARTIPTPGGGTSRTQALWRHARVHCMLGCQMSRQHCHGHLVCTLGHEYMRCVC